jgi:hypothetical protein
VPSHLFALERYDAAGEEVTAPAAFLPAARPGPLGGAVRLVAAVRLAADDVVLALVEGPDAETVAALAAAAGWRVDRLTPASWLWPPEPGPPDAGPSDPGPPDPGPPVPVAVLESPDD